MLTGGAKWAGLGLAFALLELVLALCSGEAGGGSVLPFVLLFHGSVFIARSAPIAGLLSWPCMGFLVGTVGSRLLAGLGAAAFAIHAVAVLSALVSSYSFWSGNSASLWRDLAEGNLCTITAVLIYLGFQASAWRRLQASLRGERHVSGT